MNAVRIISAISGLTLTGWPLVVLLENGVKESLELWLVISSAILITHVLYWFGFEYGFRKINESFITQCETCLAAISVTFGLPLFGGTYYLNAKILSIQVESSFTLPFISLTFYILSLSAILELALGFLIVTCITSLFETVEQTHRMRQAASYFIWAMFTLFLSYCSAQPILTSEMNQDNCSVLKIYFLISFLQLAVMQFGLLNLAKFFWSDENFEADTCPPLLKRLGLFYILFYFPLGIYWFIQGFGYLSNGSIDCKKSSTNLMFSYIYYGWTLVPGYLVILCVLLGLIGILFSLILRKLFPNYFIIIENNMNEQNNVANSELDEPLSIQFETQEFDPKKYPEGFVQEEVCAICLDDFKEKQNVVHWKSCQHLFHHECIQYWTQRKKNCPICKREYAA